MGVDGGIPGSPSEVLSLLILDMLAVSLDVALGQPEVDYENFIGGLVQTHTEVVRFDIAMYEMSVVDVLDP